MKGQDLRSPLVSVLIPAHNAARWIFESVSSALAQTHADLEVIVVDDASTDGTAAVVEEIAATDRRITLVRHPHNLGVASARNRALQAARGDFIAPLDADDLWHPHKIARQLSRLTAAGRDTGVVYCWSADIDGAARVIGRRLDLDRYEGDVYAPLVVTNFLGNASVPLMRKDLVRQVGGWDASLRHRGAQGCEDWQLYLRLAERCDFALEPAFLVGYRRSEAAMSRDVGRMRRSYDLVMGEAKRDHPELPASIFRWSRSAFDQYAAETLAAAGYRLDSLLLHMTAIARDPTWLARRSTRKKVKRWLRRRAGRAHRTPELLHFGSMSPEPGMQVDEGPLMSRRRLILEAARTSSPRTSSQRA